MRAIAVEAIGTRVLPSLTAALTATECSLGDDAGKIAATVVVHEVGDGVDCVVRDRTGIRLEFAIVAILSVYHVLVSGRPGGCSVRGSVTYIMSL